ncbi:MAG: hypothetical protein DLM72_09310 [Candidatus Nitrosopolaris wilkensis]|nr:MAG: hypothetical protein DLM72_09310 [Candidatus Nitrosopolaris wilkensis]
MTNLHGCPLRLRIETQLGFKIVKWIRAIEFVTDYRLCVSDLFIMAMSGLKNRSEVTLS